MISYRRMCMFVTCKSLSEALILASTNPQYDNRLFFELPVQSMKIPSLEHVVYINCSECQNKKQFVYTTSSELNVLNWQFNEKYFIISWVSWCKNKCFWKRFTCTAQVCFSHTRISSWKETKVANSETKNFVKAFSAARRKENHLVVCSTYVLTLVCALCDRDAPR